MFIRLKKSHGLGGRVHDRFQSHIIGQFQSVRCGVTSSTSTMFRPICGVPQRSVLYPDPLTAKFASALIREEQYLRSHLYVRW